jgi:cysteinyl-tRNA synthetase
LRLYLLSHHYRERWEYRDDELDEWASLAEDLREAADFPAYGIEDVVDVGPYRERFHNALEDDLNTPAAMDALRDIGRVILEAPEEDDGRKAQATLRELADVLGLTLNG